MSLYTVPLVKNTFLHERETQKALSDFVKDARILSMGKECKGFEDKFASYQGRKTALLFNSGGSANLALLQSLKNLGKLNDGDLIGFSAVTWSTNPMPIIQLGMIPVALDCSRATLNISSVELERCLEEYGLKALFITNALGFSGDLDRIKNICEDKGIILLEDNCESLGSELKGKKLGNFGLASTFSFYVSHHMSTIEGGMICTDDDELKGMVKLVRANGWDRNLEEDEKKELRAKYKVASELDARYTFYDLGFNLRPTEITGFLGSNQLKYLPLSVEKRQSNYMRIEKVMLKNKDLLPVSHDHLSLVSNFAVPILCKTPKLRDLYGERLEKMGIETRPLIAGNIQNQPFYRRYVSIIRNLPDAEFIHTCGLYCGNHPDYTEKEILRIEESLRSLR